jgi:hypothetical protein
LFTHYAAGIRGGHTVKLITDIGDVNITRGYRDGPAIATARDQGGAQVIDQRIRGMSINGHHGGVGSALTEVWRGDISWPRALTDELMTIDAPSDVRRAVPVAESPGRRSIPQLA